MQSVFIGPRRHPHFTSHNISLAKRPPLYYLCNSITRAERTFTAFRLSLGSKKGFNNQSLADFFLALNRNFPSLKKVSTHATAQGLLPQKLNFVQFNSFFAQDCQSDKQSITAPLPQPCRHLNSRYSTSISSIFHITVFLKGEQTCYFHNLKVLLAHTKQKRAPHLHTELKKRTKHSTQNTY